MALNTEKTYLGWLRQFQLFSAPSPRVNWHLMTCAAFCRISPWSAKSRQRRRIRL
jgi:hypothetical protein